MLEADASMRFNLAPLEARRDIAMLGLLLTTVLSRGPPHVKQYLLLDSGKKLKDPRGMLGCPLKTRSAFGLVVIYNRIPENLKESKTVKAFETALQILMNERF